MTVDWDIVQFKKKIIDNARYLFSNYIDTSKGLEPLYNRPEISSEKAKCYKNYNLVRVMSDSGGDHITAWKIDDAANVNKMYVRAKVNVLIKIDGSLILTDSTLKNIIAFTIVPSASNTDFRIEITKNGSMYTPYEESVDLSYNQFYDIEGMIDFRENTISVARDNVDKTVITTDILPSFDAVHVGFKAYHDDDKSDMLGKDVFVTWE